MTRFHIFYTFMLYLTVMSTHLLQWVLYFSYLLVDPNFPMFITVRSRATAGSLSWGKNATRFSWLSFSPGFWHLCILFWYLRVHVLKVLLRVKKSVWLRFSWDKEGYIWWYFQFVLFTLFIPIEFWNWSVFLESSSMSLQLGSAHLNDNMSHLTGGKKYKGRT